MGYELIISEKPSSAKRIAKALADGKPIKKAISKVPYYEITRGNQDIVVSSAAGHLYVVAEKEKSFKYPKFDLEWKQSSDVGKNSAFTKAYVTALKKLAKNADSFTVATDYDIEGEVIGLNIVRFICKQKDAKRMKFSTLTKDDLIEAYEKAKNTLDWGQANAGESRHFLDWMFGINLSRALMDSIKKAGSFKIMSIGRVQGPSLKLLVKKEKEIQKFVPEKYWQIKLSGEKDGVQIEAFHKGDRFVKKEEAEWFFGKAKDAGSAKVSELTRKEYKQPPPNPFDLGSLQTESYRHFGFSPKRTLQVAQNLYSSGFISYPRTSSQKLTPKIGFQKILKLLSRNDTYTELAEQLIGKDLKPNDGKKTDPAHPAIYPTGIKPGKLDEDEVKVYDLVVKRFFSTFGEWAVRESIKVELDANGEMFITNGKRTVEPAWHKFYDPYVKQEESELPEMKKGDDVKVHNIELLEKETEPPRRYTPASLVKELEKRNLGTKATRADIIESLYNRNYVKDKSIAVTELGMKTAETLTKYCSEILDDKLTRHFEAEMEKIRKGKLKQEELLEESQNMLVNILAHFDENKDKIGEELKDAHIETLEKQNYIGPCPNCDGSLTIRRAKKSRKVFAACDKYPDCETTMPLPQNALVVSAEKQCEQCNNPMIKIIQRRRRPQEVCVNPECPTKKIDESNIEERICPKCKNKLILRKSVYGAFYGCEKYPKCRHTEKIEKEK